MVTKLSALAERLRVDESQLKALDGLTKAQVAEVEAVVEAAIKTRAEEINKNLEEALQAIPRPLRGRAASLMGVDRG